MFQAIFSINQDSVVGCGRCSQHTYLVQSTDSQSFIFSLSGSCLNCPSGSASGSSGGVGRDGGTQTEEGGGLTSSILFHLLLLIFRWEVHRKHCVCMSLSSLVYVWSFFNMRFPNKQRMLFSKEIANNTQINSLSGPVHTWKDHLRRHVLEGFVQQVQSIASAGVDFQNHK